VPRPRIYDLYWYFASEWELKFCNVFRAPTLDDLAGSSFTRALDHARSQNAGLYSAAARPEPGAAVCRPRLWLAAQAGVHGDGLPGAGQGVPSRQWRTRVGLDHVQFVEEAGDLLARPRCEPVQSQSRVVARGTSGHRSVSMSLVVSDTVR